MSEETLQRQPGRGWLAWSTRDLLITAVTGLVFGVLLSGLAFLYLALLLLGPLFQWGLLGPYFLPGFFMAYVIRRPGAALLVSIFYGLVAIVTPLGPIALAAGAGLGLGSEIAIAIVTRYRTFSSWRMVATGGITAALLLLPTLPHLLDYLLPVTIGIITLTLLSCGIAGILAKLLADAVARTGTLSGTALGQARNIEI